MRGDEGLRSVERELAASPGDGEAWARLSRDYQRKGRAADAVQIALRGYHLHPGDAALRERLGALGCGQGPWPSFKGGTAGTQASPLPGPDEGVQRWRLELPRQPLGRPLVDLQGRVVLRAEPSGLMRVTADAREAELLTLEWPSDVTPILHDGRPAAFDPALGGLTSLAKGSDPPSELWTGAVDTDGRTYGLGPKKLCAVDAEGLPLWTRFLPRAREVATSPGGPVYVVLADPVIGRESAFDHPGRVLALDPDTGRTLRSLSEGRSLCGDGQLAVAVAADGALVAQLGMDVFCESASGERRWRRKVEWAAPPAVGAKHVVLANTIEGVVGVDLQTGEKLWRQRELRTSRAPALDARGNVYVVGQGWFAGIDPEGELLFHLPLPSRGPLGHVAIGYANTAFFTIGHELVAVR